MLNKVEYYELVRLIQIIDLGHSSFPEEKAKRRELENKALRRQIITANMAAKYPALANHMHKANFPYSSMANPFTMVSSR